MREETRQAALKHAKSQFPIEACGLIIIEGGREVFIACANVSTEDSESFRLSSEEYANAEDRGEIVGIFHSHPNAGANPSEADRVGVEGTGVSWHIVGLPSEIWTETKPVGYKAPLVGREFHYGVLDCYSIVRDWYQQELNIDLPDADRSPDGWWNKGMNLYVENFEAVGFRKTDELKRGNVILMQVLSPVPNHAAVYLGDDVILHHLYGRLSTREIYGGYYAKHTSMVLEYVGK